jgi:hypothetical protein
VGIRATTGAPSPTFAVFAPGQLVNEAASDQKIESRWAKIMRSFQRISTSPSGVPAPAVSVTTPVALIRSSLGAVPAWVT